MKKVAVVIPYYHSDLSDLEQIAFSQCLKILYRYPIVLVVPDNMKESEYPTGHEVILMKVPSQWLQSISTYNNMMLDVRFYSRFLEYEYILIYQLDAFVFKDELERFCDMQYDYIGAPWTRGIWYFKNVKECLWVVGNGGLSLRNVKASINVLRKHSSAFWKIQEDIYWAIHSSKDFRVAPIEVARQFSIEENVRKMIALNGGSLPFGCHAWTLYDFAFWKPFFEKEGYNIRREFTGGIDKEIENEQRNLLLVPEKIVCEAFNQLTHMEKNIYVWGAGNIGQEFILFLRHFDFSVKCVDSDEKRWGKYLWDVRVDSPDILRKVEKKVLIVITTVRALVKEEIRKQLSYMGFYHGKDVFFYDEVRDMILRLEREKIT